MKNRLVLVLFLSLPPMLHAQEQQFASPYVSTQSYQAGWGGASILDTYLTPERFSGSTITLLTIAERQRKGSSWSTIIQNQLHISTAKDRAGNESMLEGCYNLFWGRYYGWKLYDGNLHLQVGGLANLGLGFLYNMRSNANNPAQGRFSLSVMPSAIATWRLPFLRQRLSVRYEFEAPLVGLMFSPNFGQSYYEMFVLGNYDHNVVPTTFVSSPTFRQQLTVRYRLKPTLTLTLGYLGDYQQAKVNGLKQHVRTHSVMLGLVKRLSWVHYANE